MYDEVKIISRMIFYQISKHHIMYDVINFDEYHIKYDFMHMV